MYNCVRCSDAAIIIFIRTHIHFLSVELEIISSKSKLGSARYPGTVLEEVYLEVFDKFENDWEDMDHSNLLILT